jgi:hypothetical protein
MPCLMRDCALGRGIQYAAPPKFDYDLPGVLDRPPQCAIAHKAGDDSLGI